jgi:photosystem II stability/assembly factor-like uncharacterized protein
MCCRAWIVALAVCVLASAGSPLCAQWQILNSNTTADLRGIDNVGGGVAWASGTNGTVLRTEDGGYLWQPCTIPPGAEKLDFRGIQAFDANTAIVMSSGTGDLSRLYKTTDGCQTWKLLFTNPDKDGFWDAIVAGSDAGLIVGDPVGGRFAIFSSTDSGLEKWDRYSESRSSWLQHFGLEPVPYEGEGLFAASNSNAKGSPETGLAFVTGGEKGAFFAYGAWTEHGNLGYPTAEFAKVLIPLAKGKSAGAFSLACTGELPHSPHLRCVAVGGDYLSADSSDGVAAFSSDPRKRWKASEVPPHGYRSAVAYDETTKTWITVGPNGTDVSTDDGRNWRAVHPDAALHEPADADRNWNALSLPYVVGPHGRIGKLELLPMPSDPRK